MQVPSIQAAAVKTVLIVDDEQPARMRLKAMVDALADYQVIAEAENGRQAMSANEKLSPDIVLLDIRMPEMDGLAAAAQLSEQDQPPAVIFCTAYDEHALAAFDAQAVGYLLKPVSRLQLADNLAKAQSVNRSQLANLVPESVGPELSQTCLSVRTRNGHELLAVSEIRALIADNKYVSAYTHDREVLLDLSLKELEGRFAKQFLRVHRNALVAIRYIRGLEKCEDIGAQSIIRLEGCDISPVVSRRHLPELRRLLKALS
ncbi:MAG: LytTR family DNA-binding domain-containing protein [Pseudomonadales bacterium]